METKDIKKKIQLALDAVEKLDEPYKLETYKIILSKSLGFSTYSSEENTEKNNETTTEELDLNQDIKKLTELCKISSRELFDVLKIENDEVILKKILTGTEAEQQIIGSQLILLGYEFALGIPEVESGMLKGVLKKSNITDRSRNFAQHMRNRKDLFNLSSTKSNQNLYSLTANKGRNSAIELLAKLAQGEEI